MKTRVKETTNTVTASTIKENCNRKPLSDKTNNENTPINMKPRKNEKPALRVMQTRKNSVNKQNENKNEVGLKTYTIVKSKPKNARKIKNKTVVNETKLLQVKSNSENKVENNSLELNNSLKETLEEQKNIENSTNKNNRINIRRRSSRFSSETKIKAALKSNKDNDERSNIDEIRSNTDVTSSIKETSNLGTILQENVQKTNKTDNSIDTLNEKLENDNVFSDQNKENTINAQNRLSVKRRSSRFSSETIKTTSRSNKNTTKVNKGNSKLNKNTSKTTKYVSKSNKERKNAIRSNKIDLKSNKDTLKLDDGVSKSYKDDSKLETNLEENPQTDESNNLIKKENEEKNTKNREIPGNSQKCIVERRSSRFSTETKIKSVSKSNKEALQSNNDTPSSNKNDLKSVKDTLKSNDGGSKLDTNLQETDKFTKSSKQTTPLKPRRLLDLKSPSSENSDPYEFKFDPKEEPKPKPKKRRRFNKFDTLSDTSEEEDNSMKRIVKKIRKNDIKQKIHITPVERKLRNRLIKVERQAGLVPQKTNKNNVKVAPQKINKTSVKTAAEKINKNIKSSENPKENAPVVNINTPAKDTSVLDEINEIANTFLEDDDVFNNSNVSISTPSRIDIISNLIARKSIKSRPTNVFNSTMIHGTPQTQPQLSPASPWRVEVSVIPRKPLNFSVKNKSFTPSYTPDIITDNKKQSTLLSFVNRTPKTDLQVTLFQNSPTRKPFENLSNSMSPIRPNRSGNSVAKRSDDSLFGFTVLSDSEDKENSPVITSKEKSPRIKENIKTIKQKETSCDEVQNNEPVIDISIPLFEDLGEKRNEKRYSRQYTRPQTKRKRHVSLKNDSEDDDSDSETEIHPTKKKLKDVLTKEEAEEAERLASHYNSYFEEIENYSLCIE